MYEKVNPSHPDKVADRISGAIVDLAYEEIVRVARDYINSIGGFEKFSGWGLIR